LAAGRGRVWPGAAGGGPIACPAGWWVGGRGSGRRAGGVRGWRKAWRYRARP